MAQRSDLQPVDHRPAVSAGSGCLAERCAASDPNLHPGQHVRVAALELEAAGGLTVEVFRRAVAVGRPKAPRNHHTLTPEWKPWGSPHGYPGCTRCGGKPENRSSQWPGLSGWSGGTWRGSWLIGLEVGRPPSWRDSTPCSQP